MKNQSENLDFHGCHIAAVKNQSQQHTVHRTYGAKFSPNKKNSPGTCCYSRELNCRYTLYRAHSTPPGRGTAAGERVHPCALPSTLPCAKKVVPGRDHLRPFSALRFMLDGRYKEVSCDLKKLRASPAAP